MRRRRHDRGGRTDQPRDTFADEVEFWQQAVENLKSGNVRLVFVADHIPDSLQAVVEYMNERMVPTSVLAVEVRQYVTADAKQLLSSRLLGQTEQARAVKGKKQPAAIRVLHAAGKLHEGNELWLLPQMLPQVVRPPAADPRLKFVLVRVSGSQGVLRYDADGQPEEVTASKGRDRVYRQLDPKYTTVRARSVNDAFSMTPGGKTLRRVGAGARSLDRLRPRA